MSLTIEPNLKLFLLKPRVVKTMVGGLVVLIVIQISMSLHDYFSFVRVRPAMQLTSKPAKLNDLQTKSAVDWLTPVFGDYVPQNIHDGIIKQSNLALTLVGILFSSDAQESQVIIRTTDGIDSVYQTGDTIPGGAVILRISAEGVLIKRHEGIERLIIPVTPLSFSLQPRLFESRGQR